MAHLILLAHGSHNADAAKEVVDLAAHLDRKVLDHRMSYAYLDLAKPSLADAIEEIALGGAEEVYVLPLFLHAGRHVTHDIPAMLVEARRRHPLITFHLLQHLGAYPGFLGLIAEIAAHPERFTVTP